VYIIVHKMSKVSKKTSKKTASKKATPTTKATVAATTAPVAATSAPVAATTKTASTDKDVVPTLGDQFNELLSQLSLLRSQLTTVTSHVRSLSKRSERELKNAHKLGRKKRKSGNRAPSGFVKPTKISVELATFLGKEKGTEMARTEVTREINTYIRAHKLQDPKNGRRILADVKLRKLLKLTKADELTYFNLQRYMSPHFAKAGKKLPESA